MVGVTGLAVGVIGAVVGSTGEALGWGATGGGEGGNTMSKVSEGALLGSLVHGVPSFLSHTSMHIS